MSSEWPIVWCDVCQQPAEHVVVDRDPLLYQTRVTVRCHTNEEIHLPETILVPHKNIFIAFKRPYVPRG